MYLPAHFAETRVELLHALIHEAPLATLITHGADGLAADLLPFELDPQPAPFGTLRGHVARANPLWREHPAEAEVLVIFTGPQSYISPSFYPGKAEHGKVVPTWNYVVVQARGRLRVIDDADWLRRLVGQLTERHEAAMAAPWQVDDAPADYIEQMLKAIVGIEVDLTGLEGKWKLSQNRNAADRAGVAAGLEANGEPAMASLVAAAHRARSEGKG
jgi:transcriptional regulator